MLFIYFILTHFYILQQVEGVHQRFFVLLSSEINHKPKCLKAKPFIKWVGGKSQLIEQLEAQLPADFDNWKNVTYIEPFVGGGAMLFYMLQRYPHIRRAIINDINPDLCTCLSYS